jgi:hypothetical protein
VCVCVCESERRMTILWVCGLGYLVGNKARVDVFVGVGVGCFVVQTPAFCLNLASCLASCSPYILFSQMCLPVGEPEIRI